MKTLHKICIMLIIGGLLAGGTPYVVMVSFDGFRYDYADRTETPNFDFLRDHGAKAESLQPVFPSKTFPNHYSLATGAYTQTHMLTSNSFYDKKFREKYSISDRKTVQDGKWYQAEPLWVTAERQGVKSASYFWVGSEAPVKGIYPSIFKYYDGSVSFEARVDSVLSWLQLPEIQRPHLIMLYFDQPDNSGHTEGPESPKVDEMVRYLDNILGRLLSGLASLPVAGEVNLVLVSDHGMTSVSEDRIIPLYSYLNTTALTVDNVGPYAQLDLRYFWQRWYIPFRLKKIPHLISYSRRSIPQRYHFVNRNTGDYLLVAESGWTIVSDSSPRNDTGLPRGNHGYDPEVKAMQGIFYAYGPAIKQGVTVETFENIHVYPLVCKLLGIAPYSGAVDAPEGRLEVLFPILKDGG
ncbi:MAG: alkaline phosphatase family protein [FCB group bacterium]|nr:alkaline phosphatase family protein [FCB group bacterium]